MKSASSEMNTHLGQAATTLAYCWKVTRTDETVLGFTTHDQDLVVDAVTYHLQSGSRTAISATDKLDVDNLELDSVLDSELITDVDIRAGLYDRAALEIFIVNWADLTAGKIVLFSGFLGDVDLKAPTFTVKAEGLLALFTQHHGRVVLPSCDADLGDARCTVTIQPTPWTTITDYALGAIAGPTIYNDRRFVVTVAGTSGATEPAWNITLDGTTADGSVTWQTKEEKFFIVGTVQSVVDLHREFVAAPANFQTTTVLPVPEWEASHRYLMGDSVRPTVANDFRYVALVIDKKQKSGKTEPTWPTTIFETVTDGDVVWQAVQDQWYTAGFFKWTTGDNAGFMFEVKSWDAAARTFRLFLATPYEVQVGDTFLVEIGCKKDLIDCDYKFANAVNHRGFPFLPGSDQMLDYPDAEIN